MGLTANEKAQTRDKFKVLVYTYDKQKFEDLFCDIMEARYSDFQRIKPQGAYGDRKNDGFIPSQGVYYQVYAPESLPSKEKDALDKLEADFNGLLKYWNNKGTIVKEFYYLVNDKYKGNYPTLNKAISDLNAKYPAIKIELKRCKSLEKEVLQLERDEIISILNTLHYTDDALMEINISDLTLIVNHILDSPPSQSNSKIPKNINFDKKITFNNLPEYIAVQLNQGYYQTHVIEEYFVINGAFTKSSIQKKLNEWYLEGKKIIDNTLDGKSSMIYEFIIDKIIPKEKRTIATISAVQVLMAYYFEHCDIFEEPTKI